MRNFSSKFLTLLAVVSVAGLGISSQAQLLWTVGMDDDGWPLTGTTGGAAANFVQENGAISPLPGSPTSTPVPQGADNDYYFAGSYTTVITGNGAYAPVGTVAANENSAERAFAAADNDLRYHFNLPSSLSPSDLLSVTFDALNLDDPNAVNTDPRYGIEVYINGVLVQTQIVIRPAQLGTDYTSPQVSLASVNAQVGPGFDNIVSLRGINYNTEGGGNWMGIDYVQLNAAPGVPPPPPSIISSVVETGGDNEATDTITAKWSGQTFPISVANEPVPGAVVGNSYTVGVFGNHAPNFVDRNHRYTNASDTVPIPAYLAGRDYIMSGNDNRDNTNYVLDVTVSQGVTAYLLVDNRLGDANGTNPPAFDATHMQWVVDQGWAPSSTGANRTGDNGLPDEVAIDEGADGTINNWFSIYKKVFPAGTFQLRQADNTGQNMYGVVVGPPPPPPPPPAAGYAGAVLADGPIAFYRFNDALPTAVNGGSLGAAADGTYMGDAAPGSEAPRPPAFTGFDSGNTALQLDGAGDFVTTVSGLMNSRPVFTMSGWIRRNADQAARTGLWGQNDLVEFGYINNNTLEVWTDNGLHQSPDPTTNPFPNGEWAHVAFVSEGSPGQLKLYTNGVFANERTHTMPVDNTFPFNIGGGGVFDAIAANGNYFNGQIDEVAVFDKALTADQIKAQYEAAFVSSPLTKIVQIGGNKVGSVMVNGEGSLTIVGGGNDIWAQRDEFTYAATEVTGDFDVQVKVESVAPNARWSKAGIMARESLSEFSRMAFPRLTPLAVPTSSGGDGANDNRFAYRTGLDNTNGLSGGEHEDCTDCENQRPSNGHKYVRLVRAGAVLTASSSADGSTWVPLGTQDTTTWGGGALAKTLWVGLGVSRHSGGNTATAEFREFKFNYTAPFAVVAANSRGNPTGVRVEFSRPVGAGAYEPLNYTLDNGATVTAAIAGPGPTSVQLTTSALTEGTTYTVNVAGVEDSSGGSLTAATTTFVHGAGYEARAIQVTHNKTDDSGYYRTSDAVAKGIGDVVAMSSGAPVASYPGVQGNTVFEDPIPDVGDPNGNERFSSRISGVLNITTAGSYIFYHCSDDFGITYLSSDDQPANKVEIAREPAWNGRREYIDGGNQPSRGVPPANISTPQNLAVGKYYLETIFSEGGGGNNGSAAWLPPGGPAVVKGNEPIPASAFMPARVYDGTLFYNLGPVQITRQPANATVPASQAATFKVVADGTPGYTYQWRRNGANIAGATGPSYTLASAQLTDDGAQFSVVVANEFSSATSANATLGVVSPLPPHVVGVSVDASFNTLAVRFDNRLDPATAQNTANYTVSGGVTVQSATVQANGRDVAVKTSALTPDTAYTVTIKDIKELLGVVTMDPNPTVANLHTGVLLDGTLIKEYYFGIAGVNVADLTASAKYMSHTPDLVCFTNLHELTDRDTYDNYGARILGFFKPDMTGNWKFYMSSDDGGEFWLSTDSSPANRVRVAREPVWNGRRDWTGTARRNATAPENQSALINLEAGKLYYMESFMKEGGGGDNLAVAAQFVGPDPANPVEPVPVAGDNVMGPSRFAALIDTGNLSVTITNQPASLTVFENASASFTVGATINNFYNCETHVIWMRDGVPVVVDGVTFTNSNNGLTLTLLKATLLDDQSKFSVSIEIPVRGVTTSAEAILTVGSDNAKPTIASSAGSASFDTITVVYSERVEARSATDLFGYVVNEVGGSTLAITAISLGADEKTVTISLGELMKESTFYKVTVNGVEDLAMNAILPDSMTTFQSFVFSCGFVLKELYQGLSTTGVAISELRSSPKYPHSPDLVRYGGLLELNTFDEFEGYGARLSGLLIPPVSGNYTFYLAADDNGEFWLSTDSTAANLVNIANEPVWSGRRTWTGEAGGGGRVGVPSPSGGPQANISGPIALVAGQKYYFEALVKEGGGGDNLAVAWQIPGDPVPAIGSSPIAGNYLAAPANPAGATINITQQPVNQTFLIGGGPATVTFSVTANATTAGNPNQPIFYIWQRDNGAGFANVSGANEMALTLTPTLADNGARFRSVLYVPGAVRTTDVATLTVAQPNTPPQFVCGPAQQTNQGAGAQVVPNWATGISPHSITRVPLTYNADFSTLPAGSTLGGTAAVTGGILHLTDAINSLQNSWVTPAVPGQIESLTVAFKVLMGGGTCCGSPLPDGSGASRPADGLSVTIGDVIIPVSFPTAAEEGAAVGNGFAVNIDTWDNNGTDEAPALDVKVAGGVVAFQSLAGEREGGRPPAGPLVNDPATGQPLSFHTGTNFATVRIHLDADGTLDVDFKGVRVIDNVQLGLTLPLANARLAFGARTGGANENHWIDDLQVEALMPDASGGEAGQTVHFNVSNDNPSLFSVQPAVSADGTLTYTPAPGRCGLARVTVEAQDSGGTANGGDDTSAPCSFDLNLVCITTNACPVADARSLTVEQGASVNFQLTGTDSDGDALTYALVQSPAHGVVVLQPSGAGTYTPAAGYSGPDSFSFTVNDGVCTSPAAVVSVTVRTITNQRPTAKIVASPLYDFDLDHQVALIGCAGDAACLVLDGSQSSDPDGDALTYQWFLEPSPVPFATGVLVTNCLEAGTHTIVLAVDDGHGGTATDSVTVEVIDASEALGLLIDKVNSASIARKNKRPFIATLKAATASIDRGQCHTAANQLHAFQNKVRAQVSRNNPDDAECWIRWAQHIIDALNR